MTTVRSQPDTRRQPLAIDARVLIDGPHRSEFFDFVEALRSAPPTRAARSEDLESASLAVQAALVAKVRFLSESEGTPSFVLGEFLGAHRVENGAWVSDGAWTSQLVEIRSRDGAVVAGHVVIDFA